MAAFRSPGAWISSPAARAAAPRPAVLYCLGERCAVARLSRAMFGRKVRRREYAALAGAPHGAETLVGVLDGSLYLEMRDHQGIGCLAVTLVHRIRQRLVIVNDGFHIHRRSFQGQGIGLEIVSRQIHQAKRMGARRIDVTAGRSSSENGYYTWPRFGFDAPLPLEIQIALPTDLGPAQNLLDLMRSRKGRSWWRGHGTTIDVSFDLSEHSRSWRAFRRYRARKTKPFPDPMLERLVPGGGDAGKQLGFRLETARWSPHVLNLLTPIAPPAHVPSGHAIEVRRSS